MSSKKEKRTSFLSPFKHSVLGLGSNSNNSGNSNSSSHTSNKKTPNKSSIDKSYKLNSDGKHISVTLPNNNSSLTNSNKDSKFKLSSSDLPKNQSFRSLSPPPLPSNSEQHKLDIDFINNIHTEIDRLSDPGSPLPSTTTTNGDPIIKHVSPFHSPPQPQVSNNQQFPRLDTVQDFSPLRFHSPNSSHHNNTSNNNNHEFQLSSSTANTNLKSKLLQEETLNNKPQDPSLSMTPPSSSPEPPNPNIYKPLNRPSLNLKSRRKPPPMASQQQPLPEEPQQPDSLPEESTNNTKIESSTDLNISLLHNIDTEISALTNLKNESGISVTTSNYSTATPTDETSHYSPLGITPREIIIPTNQNSETPNKNIPLIDKNRFPLKKQPYQQAINTNILKTDITPEKTSAVTTESIYSTQSGISSSSINKKNSSLINSTPSNNLHKLLDTDKLQNNTEPAITKLSSNNPFLDSRFLDDDDDEDVNEDGYEYIDKDLENVDGNKDKSITITKPTQFSEIVNVFGIAPNKVRNSSNNNSSSTVNKSSVSGSTSIGTADEEYFDVEDTTQVLAHAELAVSNHHYANSPISPTKPAMNTGLLNSLNSTTNNRESENSKKEEKEQELGDGLGNQNDYIRYIGALGTDINDRNNDNKDEKDEIVVGEDTVVAPYVSQTIVNHKDSNSQDYMTTNQAGNDKVNNHRSELEENDSVDLQPRMKDLTITNKSDSSDNDDDDGEEATVIPHPTERKPYDQNNDNTDNHWAPTEDVTVNKTRMKLDEDELVDVDSTGLHKATEEAEYAHRIPIEQDDDYYSDEGLDDIMHERLEIHGLDDDDDVEDGIAFNDSEDDNGNESDDSSLSVDINLGRSKQGTASPVYDFTNRPTVKNIDLSDISISQRGIQQQAQTNSNIKNNADLNHIVKDNKYEDDENDDDDDADDEDDNEGLNFTAAKSPFFNYSPSNSVSPAKRRMVIVNSGPEDDFDDDDDDDEYAGSNKFQVRAYNVNSIDEHVNDIDESAPAALTGSTSVENVNKQFLRKLSIGGYQDTKSGLMPSPITASGIGIIGISNSPVISKEVLNDSYKTTTSSQDIIDSYYPEHHSEDDDAHEITEGEPEDTNNNSSRDSNERNLQAGSSDPIITNTGKINNHSNVSLEAFPQHSNAPFTYDRRETPTVIPLHSEHAKAASHANKNRRPPPDFASTGRPARSVSTSTAQPDLFNQPGRSISGGTAAGAGTASNAAASSSGATGLAAKTLNNEEANDNQSNTATPPDTNLDGGNDNKAEEQQEVKLPLGKGKVCLYVERTRKKAGTSYTEIAPKYLPIGIRASSTKGHLKTISRQSTNLSVSMSNAAIKHNNIKPRLLASEIDDDELPDSKLSHLSTTKTTSETRSEELLSVAEQLRRLQERDQPKTSEETLSKLSPKTDSKLSGTDLSFTPATFGNDRLARYSSVRSARGVRPGDNRNFKLFVANPDTSSSDEGN
ncbi:hypothetical protein BVG19_g1012 [[Candida] boidinii]|nr:hypothetical protein BVG19_g1012 [[Candida] boidinii]OWB50621.1 hypothetical protein B5S27_g2173 [[Candida] boidinii]